MKSAKDYFNLGYGARRSNLTKEANPLLFGKGWPHEAWNMGFDFAELELNSPGQDEALLERVPAQPYWQGWNSYMRGIAPEDCPYGPDTDDAAKWNTGFADAKHDGGAFSIMAAFYRVFKWIAGLAIAAGLLWAFANVTWPKASGELSDCQRNSPPWHTAECRR